VGGLVDDWSDLDSKVRQTVNFLMTESYQDLRLSQFVEPAKVEEKMEELSKLVAEKCVSIVQIEDKFHNLVDERFKEVNEKLDARFGELEAGPPSLRFLEGLMKSQEQKMEQAVDRVDGRVKHITKVLAKFDYWILEVMRVVAAVNCEVICVAQAVTSLNKLQASQAVTQEVMSTVGHDEVKSRMERSLEALGQLPRNAPLVPSLMEAGTEGTGLTSSSSAGPLGTTQEPEAESGSHTPRTYLNLSEGVYDVTQEITGQYGTITH
jgi:uncharacterized coiled-coil protein SlyX/cell division protein ZapA (FtsZ GTPase activity inhibitor)